ncbi:hypothetical protein [Luteimonas pelagia]
MKAMTACAATVALVFAGVQPAARANGAADAQVAQLDACRAVQDPLERDACAAKLLLELPDVPPELRAAAELGADVELTRAMQAWQVQADDALRVHARRLAARGTAEGLFAAAVLWPKSPGVRNGPAAAHADPMAPAPEAQAWFDAARAVRPSFPPVAWIEALDCATLSDACDPADARARLARIAPGNAAVHLLELNARHDAGDLAGARAALARMAAADGFDDYQRAILGLLVDANAGVDWPPLPPDAADAMGRAFGAAGPLAPEDVGHGMLTGWLVAVTMPGARQLSAVCSDDGGQMDPGPALRADCIAALATIADAGTSVLAQNVALPQLVRLTAGTDAGAAWRERLRDLYWVMDRGGQLLPGLPGSGVSGGTWLRWWAAVGEVEATRRLMRQAGLPAEAPDGWLPAGARHRALVTTGRAPD